MRTAFSKAAFLDRDGVLIEDLDVLTECSKLRLLPGVPEAMKALRRAGFQLIAVTNQPVVARGLITEPELQVLHQELQDLLRRSGAELDAIYFCPHHPNATLSQYRIDCECRKPRPGMLVQAAKERGVNLAASFMVGDRISDIAAGVAAGCRTVLVETGKHLALPIQSSVVIDPSLRADFRCANLMSAAEWITSLP